MIKKQFAVNVDVTIRPCRKDDLPDLEWFGLMREFRELIGRAYQRQEQGEVVFLVADVNGFPAGQIWLDLVKKQDEGVGIIWALRVIPPLQRAGIGSQLIKAAEEALSERGFQWAEIGVDLDNTGAKRLYERLGYQVISGDTETWSYTTPEGELIEVTSEGWLLRKRLG